MEGEGIAAIAVTCALLVLIVLMGCLCRHKDHYSAAAAQHEPPTKSNTPININPRRVVDIESGGVTNNKDGGMIMMVGAGAGGGTMPAVAAATTTAATMTSTASACGAGCGGGGGGAGGGGCGGGGGGGGGFGG